MIKDVKDQFTEKHKTLPRESQTWIIRTMYLVISQKTQHWNDFFFPLIMEATAFLLLFDHVLPKRIWAEKICVTSESYLFRFPFFPSFGWMKMGIEFEGSASSDLVFSPAASALPGSFLEIQVLCPHPRHTESETLVLEFSTPCMGKKKPGGSDAG